MSGVMTLARYKALVPDTPLTDAQIRQSLSVAQSIAESLSSLTFGSEVSAVASSGTDYTLTVYGGQYEIGQSVRLIGGGSPSTAFEITDTGVSGTGQWIKISSASAVSPTKVLPIVECVGEATDGTVLVARKPVFSVSSVLTRASRETLWSSSSVTTLTTSQYEVVALGGIKAGVYIVQSAIPLILEGGPFLVKRMTRQPPDGIKVTYVAGFYSMVPADIESAIMQLVPVIHGASVKGGVFASESHDYYSYQQMTAEQVGVLPHAAVAILRRYARLA